MDLKQIARQLVELGGMPRAVAALLDQQHNQVAFEREHAKDHSLVDHRLSDAEWGAFKAHLLDGEGVENHEAPLDDDRSLLARFQEALDADDQAEFWRLFPHLYKAVLKRSGAVRGLLGGGVTRGAHGNPAMDAARARAKEAQQSLQPSGDSRPADSQETKQ